MLSAVEPCLKGNVHNIHAAVFQQKLGALQPLVIDVLHNPASVGFAEQCLQILMIEADVFRHILYPDIFTKVLPDIFPGFFQMNHSGYPFLILNAP